MPGERARLGRRLDDDEVVRSVAATRRQWPPFAPFGALAAAASRGWRACRSCVVFVVRVFVAFLVGYSSVLVPIS